MGPGAVADEIYGEKRRLSPMIMQIAKRHRLLPRIQKPGERSSRRKSKSSMFSRRCPGELEKFEVTTTRQRSASSSCA
jgi:hypothetical protein